MTETVLSFEFPTNLAVDKFINKLNKYNTAELDLQQYALKSFYDSFDWRLYNKGLICEFNQSKTDSSLTLKNLQTTETISSIPLDEAPLFANELSTGVMRDKLSTLLEMRALLPLTTLDLQIYKINILNADQKTVARLLIEDYTQIKTRLTIQPLKGYEKAAIRLSTLLSEAFSLKEAKKTILLTALKMQGRRPGDYSSKLNLSLTPEMPAIDAAKTIYKTLLKTIKVNEQGTIDDIDSEFLHDFRVAVRRTRSGLSQIKGMFPADINAYYSEYFAWLGSITSPTRDMDVYLLSFDDYKTSLPESMRDDLNPLQDFLFAKQKTVQTELVNHLKSKKYLSTLDEWEQYLKKSTTTDTQTKPYTIKQLADKRIWKVYKRILKEGSAINDQSPPELLHDLRKNCKKLRYLMEFFQSLYPPEKIKAMIKVLKGFQDVLGNFQDYEVQERTLKHFSEEMMQQNIPSNTFLAMGVLVEKLDEKRCEARNEFAGRFENFKAPSNQAIFKFLFANNI